jgi:hypothetical protein
MTSQEIARLRYRRQYLLMPEKIDCPFQHNLVQLNDQYFLYYHIDLRFTLCEQEGHKLILLGDIFDYEKPGKSNSELLQEICPFDFDHIVEKSARYCGRFVMIYISQHEMKIFHDATAARKVYYANHQGQYWMASQSHLLAKVLGYHRTNDPAKLAYYESPDFVSLFHSNIGNSTYYDEIFQLMPNYYLDVKEQKNFRYWPNQKIVHKSPKEIAITCALLISGYMDAIASRYNLMLPVTAGKDSRTIFAATFKMRNQIFYYLNKDSGMDIENPDITIPQKLLSKFNIRFNLLEPPNVIDEDFEKIYFENNPFGSKAYLPAIYNYYKNYSDLVNLPGNNASAGLEDCMNYGEENVTLDNLVQLSKLTHHAFARNLLKQWMDGCSQECKKYGLPLLGLFYWENRLTNVILQVQVDKDIAQEEFSPFNSRLFISTLLSTKVKDIVPPQYVVYKEIMQLLWPAVLDEPLNPSAKFSFMKVLASMGLLRTSYRIKNKYLEFKEHFIPAE